jgi:hypothetical protein
MIKHMKKSLVTLGEGGWATLRVENPYVSRNSSSPGSLGKHAVPVWLNWLELTIDDASTGFRITPLGVLYLDLPVGV